MYKFNASSHTHTHSLTFNFKPPRLLLLIGMLMYLGISSLQAQCGCTGSGFNVKAGDDINLPILSQHVSLNPAQTFTGCLEVYGKFTVDVDWDLSGAEIIMTPGAEIVVQRIAANGDWLITLDIDDTEIYGCDELWKSITLRSYNNGAANSELILQNSEVRDGEYAINLPGNGSRLTVLNNTFNANYVSIYSPPRVTTPTNPNLIFISQPQEITGNTFESTYNLFPHYNSGTNVGTVPLAGAEIHNNIFFTVGPQTGTSGNTFTNLRHGVIYRNSDNCRVGGATITNLVQEGFGVLSRNSVETGVRNNTMGGVQVGFRGFDTGSVVFNNDIDANANGVQIQECQNRSNWIGFNSVNAEFAAISAATINSNDNNQALAIEGNNSLVSGTHTISVNQSNSKIIIQNNPSIVSGATGIKINSSTGDARVENNNISHWTSPFNLVDRGIELYSTENCQVAFNNINSGSIATSDASLVSTSSPNNLFCCNIIEGGSTFGVHFSGNGMDTRWNTTTFDNHSYGVKLFNAVIGDQNNRGNDFAGGNLNTDAWFDGNPLNINLSEIITQSSLMTNGLNNIIVPTGAVPQDWFTLAGNDINCQSSTFCGETPYSFTSPGGNNFSVLSGNDKKVAEFDENSEIGDFLKWETQRYLYKKLKNNSDLITTDATVQSFYNTAQNNEINSYYSISEGIRTLFLPSENQSDVMATLNSNKSNLADEIKNLQEEIIVAIPSEREALLAAQSNKASELNTHHENLEAIRAQVKQQQFQQADYLLALNQNLEPTSVFQSNEKIINQIFLETLGKDIYEFTEQEKGLINSIANQCFTVGGKAVITARSLQQFYMNINYDLEHGCNLDNARLGGTITKTPSISIFPNPTLGQFSVQFEYPIEENLALEFYDLNGRLLFADQLLIGEFNYTFKDLNLASGIYILKLKSEVGNVLTKKVTVNKF